jgi:hypothetical protein
LIKRIPVVLGFVFYCIFDVTDTHLFSILIARNKKASYISDAARAMLLAVFGRSFADPTPVFPGFPTNTGSDGPDWDGSSGLFLRQLGTQRRPLVLRLLMGVE